MSPKGSIIIMDGISRKLQQTLMLIDFQYIQDDQINSIILLDTTIELYYGNN